MEEWHCEVHKLDKSGSLVSRCIVELSWLNRATSGPGTGTEFAHGGDDWQTVRGMNQPRINHESIEGIDWHGGEGEIAFAVVDPGVAAV